MPIPSYETLVANAEANKPEMPSFLDLVKNRKQYESVFPVRPKEIYPEYIRLPEPVLNTKEKIVQFATKKAIEERENLPTFVGGTVGAIAGGIVGGIPGGIGGAYLGGSVGKDLQTSYQIKTGQRLPISEEQRAEERMIAGAGQAAGQAIGEGFGRIISRAFRPFSPTTLKPGYKIAKEELARVGSFPTAGQAALPRTGRQTGEKILESSLWGSAVLGKFKAGEQTQALKDLMTLTAEDIIGGKWDDAFTQAGFGKELLSTILDNKKASEAVTNAVYKDLWTQVDKRIIEKGLSAPRDKLGQFQIKNAIVNIAKSKKLAQSIAKESARIGNVDPASSANQLAQRLLTAQKQLIPQEAVTLRSELLEIVRKEPKNSRLRGLAETAGRQIYDSIESALKPLGDDVFTEWRFASALKASSSELFEGKQGNFFQKELIKAIKKKPEQAALKIFTKENVDNIPKILDMIGADSPTAQKMKQAYIEDVFKRTSKPTGLFDKAGHPIEVIDFQSFTGEISKMGHPALEKILGSKEMVTEWERLATTTQVLQESLQSPAPIGAALVQVGALGTVLGLKASGAVGYPKAAAIALTVLTVPAIAAKVATTKTGAKWLAEGSTGRISSFLMKSVPKEIVEQVISAGIRYPASLISEIYTKEQAKKRWEQEYVRQKMQGKKYNLSNANMLK